MSSQIPSATASDTTSYRDRPSPSPPWETTSRLWNPHDVGSFDYATQALLTSTSVTSSDTKIGFFNYHDITPITLIAGKTYQIDAVTGTEPYTDSSRVSGLTYSPAIDVISGGYHYAVVSRFYSTKSIHATT